MKSSLEPAVTSPTGASKPAPIPTAAVAVATFVVGLVVGRATAPTPEPAPPPAAIPREEHAAPRPDAEAHAHAPPPLEPAGPPPPAPRPGGAADVDAHVARVLETARATAAAPDDYRAGEAALLAAADLERLLATDPGALARALESFRGLTDAGDLEALGLVLGRIADPAVEDVALELARGDDLRARRIAALDVLDALDAPAARPVVLDVLTSERDPDLRRAALRALPDPAGASLDDAAGVVAALVRIVAEDLDPDLRRRAAIDLGGWHRHEADLHPLLEALARDPDPEVRSAAAFGLEAARRRTPEIVAALVTAMGRADEEPLVRENCWRALSALSPLPPDARAAWQAFRAERQALGLDDGHSHGEDAHDHHGH